MGFTVGDVGRVQGAVVIHWIPLRECGVTQWGTVDVMDSSSGRQM